MVDVRLRMNGYIDLGPTPSFEGTSANGRVSSFARGVINIRANSGPFLGDSVTAEARHSASANYSETPGGQLQGTSDFFVQEIPSNSPFIGSPLGFVSFDTIRSTTSGFEQIITIPITASPGDRFWLTAITEVAAYSSDAYISYANFHDNALMDLELPPGYSFTSTSGVLLTQPVPEPNANLLLAIGGLALAARGQRRLSRGGGA
ncbi:MAG: hypothetical protein AB8G23_02695 [Myxococcota bacterium]